MRLERIVVAHPSKGLEAGQAYRSWFLTQVGPLHFTITTALAHERCEGVSIASRALSNDLITDDLKFARKSLPQKALD